MEVTFTEIKGEKKRWATPNQVAGLMWNVI